MSLARAFLRLCLVLALARPCAAAPGAPDAAADVAVSTESARSAPPLLRIAPQRGAGPLGAPSIGVGVGLSEGKPLQVLVWSGSGAVAGSLAGPAGAVIGAAAGAVWGLLFSVFVHPRLAPEGERAAAARLRAAKETYDGTRKLRISSSRAKARAAKIPSAVSEPRATKAQAEIRSFRQP